MNMPLRSGARYRDRTKQSGETRRILYVEDDPKHRESAREGLRSRGPFIVDFATNLREADEHVAKENYYAVLVDVALDMTEGTERQGDDWLRAKAPELGEAHKVVVTAQKSRIRQATWLRDNKIAVVEKGTDEARLYDRLARDAGFQEESPERQPDTEEERRGKMLAQQTLSLFYDWVDHLPDSDLRDIWIDGKACSPADLKSEMQAGTALGDEFADLFIAHVREALGLGSEDD
jgi:DNA-binding NtrC family response regulator